MTPQKLTTRQIETIRHIHDFMAKNGMPPSIGELKKASGVASDQGVIEILQRLEDRGMIERTSGQARGLKLTAEACLAIGVQLVQTLPGSGPSAPTARQFKMNLQQQRIHKRLAGIDPKLARMYEGGLRVLLDETNPERIALSAHSIRESTYHLSNMGKALLSKEEEAAAKKLDVSNARQLEKLFDPQGGVRGVDRTLYDAWNQDFHRFFVEVSHHGREVTIQEYREKLFRFEEFLSRYVLPLQVEIYEHLDQQLSSGPEGADANELRFLLSRNVESYRYFFRKADVRWLQYLDQNNLLSPQWEVADYLARVAPEASEEVMKIIERLATDKSDWATRKGLIDAAKKMPPEIARRLIEKMDREQWLADPYVDWLAYSLDDLIGIFIGSSRHADALRLAALLIQRRDGDSDLKNHHYGKILKRFSAVPVADLPAYIAFLVESLGTNILRERPDAKDDGSLMWRPAIEDHDQNWKHGNPKDHLVTSLRDALSRYIEHLKATGKHNIALFLEGELKWDPQYSIFTRLKLYSYRQNATHLMPEIETSVIEQFEDTNAWHEYFHLLKDTFPQLSKTTQFRYFAMINQGPSGQHDERYIQHWKARKVAAILGHLSPAETEDYRVLVTDAHKIDNPDFLSYHGGGWVTLTSPLTETDLAAMPASEVIECLASWIPAEDRWFSSSREGLARALSTAVGKNAEAFSKEAHRFVDTRIRPVYIYHFLQGLQAGIKNNVNVDWKAIITLAAAIVERAESESLPVFEASSSRDAWEVEWNGVFQEIAVVLEAGLHNSSAGPSFENRNAIWAIIEFLCEHPDPTPEQEKGSGPTTLAINTVRGRAFHALFAYMFWCDRHLNGKGDPGSRIPQEVKGVLESHLDSARDPSLTVRSVYGQFFQWLFAYDPPWTTELIRRLFPVDDPERRYAAWETYLSNGVFPPLYRALKAQYEQAISEVRTFKPQRRYWADPIEGLAVHMAVAYVYREEEEKGALWLKFFRAASAKQRGHAVSFAGRSFVHGADRPGEKLPDTNRLQEFWEWRLKDTKDIEELKEFGWWVRAGRFNDEWMLERLIDTLGKTGGALEVDFEALSTLSALASDHPLLCARALSLIVLSKSADRLMLGYNDDLREALSRLYSTANADAIVIAEKVIDHLTKLGFETYRTIPHVQLKPIESPDEKLMANQETQ